MLPNALAFRLQKGLLDYLESAFPIANSVFKGSLARSVTQPSVFFHEPFLAIRLPFEVEENAPNPFEAIALNLKPYVHQNKAFQRLTGPNLRSTLISTGTGSGKTECFLYPILEYCYKHRGQPGVKALLIYPMNALANDQAKRLAQLIYKSPKLKGNVTAGLYVGGLESSPGKGMRADQIISDHETMRYSPPDILLTNFKMLDYLLVRPDDAAVWDQNSPQSLKFIIVDECHTFDGAQGTDLACLLRRLKTRLESKENYLCCVGASATMGDKQSTEEMRAFAEQLFGESFEPSSVITEERVTPEAFFDSYQIDDFTIPIQTQMQELESVWEFEDKESYLTRACQIWLNKAPDKSQINTLETRLSLGRKLMNHVFFQNLLTLASGRYFQLSALLKTVRRLYPEFDEGLSSQAALRALFDLISHARSGTIDNPRPFLTVSVQLWIRELTRLVAKVGRKEEIVFSSAIDLNEKQAPHYLPVINCRDCGETGWVSIKRENSFVFILDLFDFYYGYFGCHKNVVAMFPYENEANLDPKLCSLLCPNCLKLYPVHSGDDQKKPCPACGYDGGVAVVVPPLETKNKVIGALGNRFVCPFCGSTQGLVIIGLKDVTAISAELSLMFASKYNDDKKTLAFSDSVQDAAHRAGFFNSRTWRFALRGAIQRYVLNGGADNISLAEFSQGFINYCRADPEKDLWFVANFIAPNMVWMYEYENLLRQGHFSSERNKEWLIEQVSSRLKYEIMLEYGLNSDLGRSLPKSGCSALYFPLQPIKKVAVSVVERLGVELNILKGQESRIFEQVVYSFLETMLSNGDFDDPIYQNLAKELGKTNFIFQNRYQWLPIHDFEIDCPSLLYSFDKISRSLNRSTFERLDESKVLNFYNKIIKYYFVINKKGLVDNSKNILVAKIIIEELVREKLVNIIANPENYFIYGLNKELVFVSSKIHRLVCNKCGVSFSVAEENLALAEGLFCRRLKCNGRYKLAKENNWEYYRKLFSQEDLTRVVAAEHTGLLAKDDRRRVETGFKFLAKERRPWDPNVLSCTPTLELGIDIGELSTVILCGVPPGQSEFLQRTGRAGRKDGNSLTLTAAIARPHDLFFFSEPEVMISGSPPPPKLFLNASAVLERQFTAFGLDCWVKNAAASGVNVSNLVPKAIKVCLQNLQKKEQNIFPYNFLAYVQANVKTLIEDFLKMFSGQLDEFSARQIDLFATGPVNSPMRLKIEESFLFLKEQWESILNGAKELKNKIKFYKAKPQDSSFDEKISKLTVDIEALTYVINHIVGKNIYNFLSDEGILPNYAFPEAGVILKAVLKPVAKAKGKLKKEGGKKIKIPAKIYEFHRPAASAISELAPDNTFYVQGRKLSIDQIDLTTAQPALWRLCPKCSYARLEADNQSVACCPRCGCVEWSDVGQIRNMVKARLVFSNFDAKDLIGDAQETREKTFFNTQMLVDVDEEQKGLEAFEMSNRDFPFGYEFVPKATLREINFGPRDYDGERLSVAGANLVRKGFKICRACGKVQTRKDKAIHASTCQYSDIATDTTEDNSQLIEPCLFLYREFQTEAIRLLIPATTLSNDLVALESFSAAFMLGMREQFGNVDHLRACVSQAPEGKHDFQRQYLVVYDSVPGGTGYLKQLFQGQALIGVFEKALGALKSCPCKDDPQKDGCYRCLYHYRQSRNIGQISRKTALSLLNSILGGKDNIIQISSVGQINIESLLESELEKSFVEALPKIKTDESSSSFVKLTKAIIRGREGYSLRAGECVWELEPQVKIDQAYGLPIETRADFVLWPVKFNENKKPVAVFVDGFRYHKESVDRDTLKRQALRKAGFRVFTFSWSDVQSIFKNKLDYATKVLSSNHTPHPKFYTWVANQGQAALLRPDSLSPLDLLVNYLEKPSAEEIFISQAKAYAFSMLEIDKLNSEDDYNQWSAKFNPAIQAFGLDASDLGFSFGQTFFGSWHPRSSKSDLEIMAGVKVEDLKSNRENSKVIVLALLEDRPQHIGEAFEAEWNGFWHFFNLMQFFDYFYPLTSQGLQKESYHQLSSPVVAREAGSITTELGEWEECFSQLADQEAESFARKIMELECPVPSVVGFELIGDNQSVIAEAEMAWVDDRLVFLREDQLLNAQIFDQKGFRVLTSESVLSKEIFERKNS